MRRFPFAPSTPLGLIALLLLSACSEGPAAPDRAPPEITALPRALTAVEGTVVDASNDFALDLLRQVAEDSEGENLFISPLSASMALGMAMAGARGETFHQMRSTLGFPELSQEQIGEAYRGLITLLRTLDPGVEFEIANSTWVRAGFPVQQSFLDFVSHHFDARAQELDFASSGAPGIINAWVAERTRNRIRTIVDQIPHETVMYLINAIYFNGDWTNRFDAGRTRNETFHGLSGSGSVPLMVREGAFARWAGADYEAVDLPYGGAAFSMTVVLPREGLDLDDFVRSLDVETWRGLMVTPNRNSEGTVYLPRFSMEYERSLVDDLKALGMVDAFSEFADLSGISPNHRLFINEVLQKTFVAVDERGTEAAAVTKVGVGLVSMPQRFVFRADRPFLFLIRERLSGTVLFAGVIREAPGG